MSYPVDPMVVQRFKEFRLNRKYKWLILGISEEGSTKTHIVMDTCSDKTKTVEDLVAALPDAGCRYVCYEHEYTTTDGRKADKLYFITWCPRVAYQALKMEYTTARRSLRPVCDGCFDVAASTGADIISGVTGKAEADDDDVEEEGDDWMDE